MRNLNAKRNAFSIAEIFVVIGIIGVENQQECFVPNKLICPFVLVLLIPTGILRAADPLLERILKNWELMRQKDEIIEYSIEKTVTTYPMENDPEVEYMKQKGWINSSYKDDKNAKIEKTIYTMAYAICRKRYGGSSIIDDGFGGKYEMRTVFDGTTIRRLLIDLNVPPHPPADESLHSSLWTGNLNRLKFENFEFPFFLRSGSVVTRANEFYSHSNFVIAPDPESIYIYKSMDNKIVLRTYPTLLNGKKRFYEYSVNPTLGDAFTSFSIYDLNTTNKEDLKFNCKISYNLQNNISDLDSWILKRYVEGHLREECSIKIMNPRTIDDYDFSLNFKEGDVIKAITMPSNNSELAKVEQVKFEHGEIVPIKLGETRSNFSIWTLVGTVFVLTVAAAVLIIKTKKVYVL